MTFVCDNILIKKRSKEPQVPCMATIYIDVNRTTCSKFSKIFSNDGDKLEDITLLISKDEQIISRLRYISKYISRIRNGKYSLKKLTIELNLNLSTNTLLNEPFMEVFIELIREISYFKTLDCSLYFIILDPTNSSYDQTFINDCVVEIWSTIGSNFVWKLHYNNPSSLKLLTLHDTFHIVLITFPQIYLELDTCLKIGGIIVIASNYLNSDDPSIININSVIEEFMLR